MSSPLFGQHCPVTHCAPKRTKRTWGRTVVGALALLLLAALAGWLLHCVRHAGEVRLRTGVSALRSMPLTMAPVPSQGVVVGVLMGLSAIGIAMAVLWGRRHEVEAELQWTAKGAPLLCPDDQVKVLLGLEDLRGIVHASRSECRMAQLFVAAALTTTDLDDYGDALRAAQAKIQQVTRTLGDLQQCLNAENTEVQS